MNTNGCITIMAIIIMKFIDENENKLMQCSCLVEWARLNVVSCARLYSSGAHRQTQTTVLFKSTSGMHVAAPVPECQSAIESSRN